MVQVPANPAMAFEDMKACFKINLSTTVTTVNEIICLDYRQHCRWIVDALVGNASFQIHRPILNVALRLRKPLHDEDALPHTNITARHSQALNMTIQLLRGKISGHKFMGQLLFVYENTSLSGCSQLRYRSRFNSRPCPYMRPPIIFWSYKPNNNVIYVPDVRIDTTTRLVDRLRFWSVTALNQLRHYPSPT